MSYPPDLPTPRKHRIHPAIRSVLVLAVLLTGAPLASVVKAEDAAATGSIHGRIFNGASGRYVGSATVRVEGTNIQAVTNAYGEYDLQKVPAGEATLTATYTGQEPVTAVVNVPAGATATKDFVLGTSGSEDETLMLEAYEVKADRFENAAQLAIHEERMAPNIKNVVSTDAFGEIAQGNLGEFVKYLPGVQIGYGGTYNSGADATTISVRGFDPRFTGVYIDGVPVANAAPGALTETVSLDLLTINQASRIELTKVPTPDMPTDSMGGSINLITKTSFEYARPSTTIDAFLNLNSENLDLFKKTPGPANKKTYKALPNIVFNYIRPVNDKFGFAVNVASYNQFNENHNADIEWMFEGDDSQHPDGYFADLRHPFVSHLEIRDRPREEHRHSAGFRLDYRPWEGGTIAASYQYSKRDSRDVTRITEMESEEAEDWGPTFVTGADGEAEVSQTIRSLDTEGTSHFVSLRLTHRKGPWDIDARFSTSRADASLVDAENGHFSELQLPMSDEEQLVLENINDGVPSTIKIFDEDGNPIDPSRLSSYHLDYDGTEPMYVRAGNTDSTNLVDIYKLDVRRDLDFIPTDAFHLALKAGYYQEDNIEKKLGRGTNYQYEYIGPVDAFDVNQYRDDVYTNIEPGFGLPPWQWADVYKVYSFFQANPDYFTDTSDDTTHGGAGDPGSFTSVAANNWREYVNTNKRIKETQRAWYVQMEGQFFNDRLTAVGGLRNEESRRDGHGPYRDKDWQFLKTPDGLVYKGDPLHPNGVNITNAKHFAEVDRDRMAAAGVTWDHVVLRNSAEAMHREYIAQYPIHSKSQGKPSYSLNLAYKLTDDWQARFGYSRTFGRVDYEDGFLQGRVEFDQNQNELHSGTITIGNPNLEPEVSDSYDFQLAYYTKSGGKLAVSYYIKEVDNFHIGHNTVLTDSNYIQQLQDRGITPLEDYIGWTLRTTEMGVGTAKTHGYELEARQKLGFLGRWAEGFWVFGNYSIKKKSENQDATGQLGATADKFGAAGLAFDSKLVSFRVNATYRSRNITDDFTVPLYDENGDEIEDENGDETEVTIFQYEPSEVRVDASVDFHVNDTYTIYLSGRNITNTKTRKKYFDSEGLLPTYATTYEYNDFGFQWTVGVRARF